MKVFDETHCAYFFGILLAPDNKNKSILKLEPNCNKTILYFDGFGVLQPLILHFHQSRHYAFHLKLNFLLYFWCHLTDFFAVYLGKEVKEQAPKLRKILFLKLFRFKNKWHPQNKQFQFWKSRWNRLFL